MLVFKPKYLKLRLDLNVTIVSNEVTVIVSNEALSLWEIIWVLFPREFMTFTKAKINECRQIEESGDMMRQWKNKNNIIRCRIFLICPKAFYYGLMHGFSSPARDLILEIPSTEGLKHMQPMKKYQELIKSRCDMFKLSTRKASIRISVAKSSSKHDRHYCQLAAVVSATGFLAITLLKIEGNIPFIVYYV